MMDLNDAPKKAKEYAPDRKDLQEAFITGAQWVINGKFYKQADIFITEEPVGKVPAFSDWWNVYDKKRSRKKSEAKWNRLSASQKIACMKATPAYVRATSDKNYRKDPLTYLNGECWNDEIIFKENDESRRMQQLAEKAARILGAE